MRCRQANFAYAVPGPRRRRTPKSVAGAVVLEVIEGQAACRLVETDAEVVADLNALMSNEAGTSTTSVDPDSPLSSAETVSVRAAMRSAFTPQTLRCKVAVWLVPIRRHQLVLGRSGH